MAVFTPLSLPEAQTLLAGYPFSVQAIAGISGGVENSNFLLNTTIGPHILTIFERRISFTDLPYFVALLHHWDKGGIPCPVIVPDTDGETIQTYAGKPVMVSTFMPGTSVHLWDARQTEAAGRMLARLHLAGQAFAPSRANHMGLSTLADLARTLPLDTEAAKELTAQEAFWPEYRRHALPYGPIHGDYFADNVFFQGDTVSAVIDPYFACQDYYVYDLAIALNAWAMDAGGQWIEGLRTTFVRGYETVRPLSEAERQFLPRFGALAALRFYLTRLEAQTQPTPAAVVHHKNPAEYLLRLRTWQASP